MTKTSQFIADHCIIPSNVNEQFLPLDLEDCRGLRELGVFQAGLSDLCPPYQISIKRPAYHKILFSLAGEATVSTKHKSFDFHAQEALFLPAHKAHAYLPHGHWKLLWFHIWSSEHWKHPPNDVSALPSELGAKLASVAEILLDTLWQSQANSNAHHSSHLLANGLQQQYQSFIHQNIHESKREHHHPKTIKTLWQNIHSKLNETWTIERIAKLMHCSPSQCFRRIKAEIQISPMEWVTQLRMTRAKQLLLQKHLSVSQIAEQVGYQNPFSFSRAFKKHEGQSPQQFKSSATRKGSPTGETIAQHFKQ